MKQKTKISLLSLAAIPVVFLSGCAGIHVTSHLDCDTLPLTKVEDFSSIKIENDYANITIKQGDDYALEYEYYYSKVKPTYSVKDGVLDFDASKTVQNTFLYNNANHSTLTIYVPADADLKKLDINSDAGNLTLKKITADTVEADMAAGNVSIKKSKTNSLDLSLAAGNLMIDSSTFDQADADVSAGNFLVSGLSNPEEYSYDLSVAAGEIKVNHKNQGTSYHTDSKKKKISADVSCGNITIK